MYIHRVQAHRHVNKQKSPSPSPGTKSYHSQWHFFRNCVDKVNSVNTFLGISISPRPYRESTENADSTQEVMVSGTFSLMEAFPSKLQN